MSFGLYPTLKKNQTFQPFVINYVLSCQKCQKRKQCQDKMINRIVDENSNY